MRRSVRLGTGSFLLEEGACVSAQFLLGWVLTATTRLSPGQSPTLAVLVAAAIRCERHKLAENRPWHARVGRIDRSTGSVSSLSNAILTACHHRLANGYGSKLLRCRRTEAG